VQRPARSRTQSTCRCFPCQPLLLLLLSTYPLCFDTLATLLRLEPLGFDTFLLNFALTSLLGPLDETRHQGCPPFEPPIIGDGLDEGRGLLDHLFDIVPEILDQGTI